MSATLLLPSLASVIAETMRAMIVARSLTIARHEVSRAILRLISRQFSVKLDYRLMLAWRRQFVGLSGDAPREFCPQYATRPSADAHRRY